jgi:hypothetical protein
VMFLMFFDLFLMLWMFFDVFLMLLMFCSMFFYVVWCFLWVIRYEASCGFKMIYVDLPWQIEVMVASTILK